MFVLGKLNWKLNCLSTCIALRRGSTEVNLCIWIIFLRPVQIPIIVNSRRYILFALQFQWDGSENINNGISDFMWIMHLCSVSLSSYHNSYQSTMELFYSKVTLQKFFFSMKQYLHFSWGNIVLNHAQCQGLHQRSIYVRVGTSASDVFFPCWESSLTDSLQSTPPAHWCRGSGEASLLRFLAAGQPKGTTTSLLHSCLCTENRLWITGPRVCMAKGPYISHSTRHGSGRDAAWEYLFQELPIQSLWQLTTTVIPQSGILSLWHPALWCFGRRRILHKKVHSRVNSIKKWIVFWFVWFQRKITRSVSFHCLKKFVQPFKHWLIRAETKWGIVCSRESISIEEDPTAKSAAGHIFFCPIASTSVSLHQSFFYIYNKQG